MSGIVGMFDSSDWEDWETGPWELLHPSVAEQHRTSTACPDLWEGKMDDGRFFYFRYRHGTARLGFGGSVDEAVTDSWNRQIDYGHPLDGIFESHEERQQVFGRLLEMGQVAEEEEG